MRQTYKLIGQKDDILKATDALGKLGRGDTRVFNSTDHGMIITTNCSPDDVESVLTFPGVKVLKFETPAQGISVLENELKHAQDQIQKLVLENHRQRTEKETIQHTIGEKIRIGEKQSREQLDALLGKLAEQYGVQKMDATRANAKTLEVYITNIGSATQKIIAENNTAYQQLKAEYANLKSASTAKPAYTPRSQIADHTLASLLGIPDDQRETVTEFLEAYDAKVVEVSGRGVCLRDAKDIAEKLSDLISDIFAHLELNLTTAQKQDYVSKVKTYLAGEGEWNSSAWNPNKTVNAHDIALAYGKSASWAAQRIKASGLSKKSGSYAWGEISSAFKAD